MRIWRWYHGRIFLELIWYKFSGYFYQLVNQQQKENKSWGVLIQIMQHGDTKAMLFVYLWWSEILILLSECIRLYRRDEMRGFLYSIAELPCIIKFPTWLLIDSRHDTISQHSHKRFYFRAFIWIKEFSRMGAAPLLPPRQGTCTLIFWLFDNTFSQW